MGRPAFPGLAFDLAGVFDFPLAPGEEIEMVREGHPPYAERGDKRRKEVNDSGKTVRGGFRRGTADGFLDAAWDELRRDTAHGGKLR
jgi:hypothetical protein